MLPFPEVEPGAGGRAEAAAEEQQERGERLEQRGHAGTAAARSRHRGLREAGGPGRAGPRSPAAGGDSPGQGSSVLCPDRPRLPDGSAGDEEQTEIRLPSPQ